MRSRPIVIQLWYVRNYLQVIPVKFAFQQCALYTVQYFKKCECVTAHKPNLVVLHLWQGCCLILFSCAHILAYYLNVYWYVSIVGTRYINLYENYIYFQ